MTIGIKEVKNNQMVKNVELRVPRLIPQLRREDKLVLKQWFVKEFQRRAIAASRCNLVSFAR